MTLQDMLSYFSNLTCSFLPMMFLVGLVANQLQILLLLMQVTVVRLAVFHLHWLLTGGTQAGFVWMYLKFLRTAGISKASKEKVSKEMFLVRSIFYPYVDRSNDRGLLTRAYDSGRAAPFVHQTRRVERTPQCPLFALCEYKAEEAGTVQVVKVDPRYTSQICSSCGTVRQKTLSEQWHSCECGCELERDHNAARNVKRLWLGAIRKRNPPEKPPHVCVGSRHKTITYSLPIVEGVAR